MSLGLDARLAALNQVIRCKLAALARFLQPKLLARRVTIWGGLTRRSTGARTANFSSRDFRGFPSLSAPG
ncbi:MAG: hypothetical protein DMF72_12555 [Acidobacteria bacterium]|nr:MAG: hypothetical protein DMF72_12555 [Acidobacteriota bacterium]